MYDRGPALQLTEEQSNIVRRSQIPGSFAVQAFAGTGKTSTAVEIARAAPQTPWLYIVFNRRAADEAIARVPANVTVKTAHSLAFGPVGSKYKSALMTDYKLKQSLMPLIERRYEALNGTTQGIRAFGHTVLEAINNFCVSADQHVEWFHFEESPVDPDMVIAVARECWDSMVASQNGAGMTHDGYLKIWQLRNGRPRAENILFDEAQDANPAMLDVVLRTDAKTIFIGDPWQSIYGWRGAIDTFESIGHLDRLPLTRSWRFGPAVADLANSILSRLGEPFPLVGMGDTEVSIRRVNDVDMVTARTTGGLVAEAISLSEENKRIHIVGGTAQILDWLQETYNLSHYGRSRHRDFDDFKSFAELKEITDTAVGKAYAPYVRLVEKYGRSIPDVLQKINMQHCDILTEADTVLTSGHRGKGAEANRVRVAPDVGGFAMVTRDGSTKASPTSSAPISPYEMMDGDVVEVDKAEANLLYVILTRARHVLDMSNVRETLDLSLDCIDMGREKGLEINIKTPRSNLTRALEKKMNVSQ